MTTYKWKLKKRKTGQKMERQNQNMNEHDNLDKTSEKEIIGIARGGLHTKLTKR